MSRNSSLINTTEQFIEDMWNTTHLWNNNSTVNISQFDVLSSNASTQEGFWYCAKWMNAQQDLYQTANVCFAIAFLIPKSFKQSVLLLRALTVFAFAMMALWGGTELCSPDVLGLSLLLVAINSIHTVFLVIRFLPPTLSLELTDLYLKVFKPMKVSKKHFKELAKESRFVKLEPGEAYAIEEVTPADERLSILIKGKLKVTCNDTHLHFIEPMQFVDSPEWEANREQSDGVFQVSIIAEDSSVCVCWPRMRLERVLRHRPMLKIVVDSLIGKDITHKLYSLNEFISGLEAKANSKPKELDPQIIRSASVDAVNETARGKLRSLSWRSKPGYMPVETGNDTNWKPVVARQFPKKSPFTLRAPNDKKLITQLSSASLQPTPSPKRSLSRKATSFRKNREVKFVEPTKEWSKDSEFSGGSSEWSPKRKV